MIKELAEIIKNKSKQEQIEYLAEKFQGKIAFSTSFGQEDQVITDIIFKNDIPIKVFTLDTGRLFEETYKVWDKTLEKYGKPIKAYYPDKTELEKLVSEKGPYSFYKSVENRVECCNIRKTNPLKRALNNIDLWITGLRTEQSQARNELQCFEYTEIYKTIKFNPLKTRSLKEINDYLKNNNVPFNILHNEGFLSIGCAPCTRAIKRGEDIRDGRWWWEKKSKKECGLHATRIENGKFTFSKINA